MINQAVKEIYFSQIFIKIFSAGILIMLLSCVFEWIRLEGLALFFGADIIKLFQNLKIITVTVSILCALWIWAGIIINKKNLRFVSISSGLVMLVFFYMAYSVFISENVKENEKITSGIVLILYGLLYVIPIILALKNNFKTLYMNTNLTLFFILFCQVYMSIKFNDSAVKALGMILQYTFYLSILGTLMALVSSIMLTIKIKPNIHHTENTVNTLDNTTLTIYKRK